jgi:TolA-binding protein
MAWRRLGGAVVVSALSACVPQVDTLKVDLARLDRNVGDLRSLQAEQVTEVAALRAELRQLTGRLDEIEYSQREKLGDLSTMQGDLSRLSQRMPPPAIVPVQALEADEGSIPDLPVDVGQRFAEGLTRIRAGNFAQAGAPLQEALDLGPTNAWAPQILFWIGLVGEATSDLPKAASAYLEIVSRFPKHSRTPLALLRQGTVFIRLGDKKAARLAFKKLTVDFPKSPEAQRARERLKDVS